MELDGPKTSANDVNSSGAEDPAARNVAPATSGVSSSTFTPYVVFVTSISIFCAQCTVRTLLEEEHYFRVSCPSQHRRLIGTFVHGLLSM